MQTCLQTQKEIIKNTQEKIQGDSLLKQNQNLEGELANKQNELFSLKETNFNLKKQINQLKEKNFEITTSFSEKKHQNPHRPISKLERHFSDQMEIRTSIDLEQVNHISS